ncbi:MAG: glycosyltransferase [Pseudomonadota bacterium]
MKAGGWDPYNVTEDADLGIRLARHGYATATIWSTTREDAPRHFVPWLRQRSRWFKGWWQTWLVHMRSPLALLRDLGPKGFTAFQLTLLAVLVSMLIHPFFFAAIVWSTIELVRAPPAADSLETLLYGLACANFLLGYVAAGALIWAGGLRRGLPNASPWVTVQIPVYWLLMSAAGYLALWELIWRPHHWHKTPHTPAKQSAEIEDDPTAKWATQPHFQTAE